MNDQNVANALELPNKFTGYIYLVRYFQNKNRSAIFN
jgi:hypothetical protein